MEDNSYGRLIHRSSLHLSVWSSTTALLLMFLVATLPAAELPLVENGKAEAAIVLGSDAGPLVRKAAELLRSRVEQRTGARLAVVPGAEALISTLPSQMEMASVPPACGSGRL